MTSPLPRRIVAALLGLTISTLGWAQTGEWELYWSDEFDVDGPPDPAYWTHEIGGGGWGNAERQFYTDALENSRVENGHLIIEARQEGGTRAPSYTSARLITREKVAMEYGRIEVRAKLPGETGTWPAIWMLSNDTILPGPFWPDNGEIDILETVGFERDPLYLAAIGQPFVENVHATVHTAMRNFQNGVGGVGGTTYDPAVTEEFRTYAVEWFPTRLDFYLDDLLYVSLNRDTDFGIPQRNRPEDISPWWPFQQRFFLLLNIAIGGQWGGSFNSERFPTSPYGPDGIHHGGEWPQRMEVDYVRMYRQRPVEFLTAPGALPVDRYDREYGLLLANSDSPNSALHYTSIQAGDYTEFIIYSPAEGTYALEADLNTTSARGTVTLTAPARGEAQIWSSRRLRARGP